MLFEGGIPTVLAHSFQNRIARVIAALRLVLASVFLIALAADPSQPTQLVPLGYGLLIGYVLTSAILLRIAWVSWWFDFRLSGFAFALDIVVFSLSVWFTENPAINFNSPFTAFFFFLMFAATLRWNWRVTVVSAALVAAAYLLAGSALLLGGQDVDIPVFLRRLTYMGVIAVALVLLGIQSRPGRREPPPADLVEFGALEAAVRYTARLLGAQTVAIAWEAPEEPAIGIVLRHGTVESHRLGLASSDDAPWARLFDQARGRCLSLHSDVERIFVCEPPQYEGIVALANINEGLSAPLRSGQGGRGILLAGDTPNLAVDDLHRIGEIAREVVALIDERALAGLERERAIVQTREALARDLHDSVAQALAGATFGIEALRLTIPEEATEPRRLAGELKATLRDEQAHIRNVIDRLRLAPADSHEANLTEELADAVAECQRRWGVDIALKTDGELTIGAPLAFECRQIVREAISNAVRHGRASHVSIAATAQGRLSLTIENDGAPFTDGARTAEPRTIRERVERLGGAMVVSRGTYPRLSIELPLGRKMT